MEEFEVRAQTGTYGNHRAYLDIFDKMELVVVLDILMSWTAQYADIILPETTVFEQLDVPLTRFNYVVKTESSFLFYV